MKNFLMMLTLIAVSFAYTEVSAQITTWSVNSYIATPPIDSECFEGIEVDITYCWQNLGSEKSTRTRKWAMTPTTPVFDPIGDGLEPDGEFSPGDPQPIKAITIGGITIEDNNPSGCFQYCGCCFTITLGFTQIEIAFYDCSSNEWASVCPNPHVIPC